MCGWKSGFGEWKFLSVGRTINYSFFIFKNKNRLGKGISPLRGLKILVYFRLQRASPFAFDNRHVVAYFD